MASRFVYVTYIRTTPQKLWQALTRPEFIRQYWFGVTLDTTWKKGAPWQMVFEDGTVTDAGEIVEIKPRERLVIKWRHELSPELKAEGFTRCTFEIAKERSATRLTITHESPRNNSKTIAAVAGGWPMILSGLKTLLETGSPLGLRLPS
jgi:uncharacterized protein YndB with AHSA1/START domain